MAATELIPDLVQLSKLDTQLHTNPRSTQHVQHVPGRTTTEKGTPWPSTHAVRSEISSRCIRQEARALQVELAPSLIIEFDSI